VAPLHRTDDGEIAVVTCRSGRLPPEILVDAKKFGALLEKVRDRFDIILIDTPAMHSGAVAMQASAQADLTLLIVNMARTSIRDVTAVATELRSVDRAELAVVTASFSRAAPFPVRAEVITPPTPAAPAAPLAVRIAAE
jgi:MinD-like ATPase involved in chromosome partitioning or flagellar assembly